MEVVISKVSLGELHFTCMINLQLKDIAAGVLKGGFPCIHGVVACKVPLNYELRKMSVLIITF